MALELTTKYAEKIDERYFPLSVTAEGTNQDYSWEGAATIKVTSVGAGAMGDFDRGTGYGAVGTAENMSNTVKSYLLSKDRFFRLKLDKMDENETAIKAEEVIARQLREVVMPEIEAHRLATMTAGITANAQFETATDDAYADFLAINEKLDEANVPMGTRRCFATAKFINKIKKSGLFIKASDMAQEMLVKGAIGEIDGVPVFKVNGTYLGTYEAVIVDKAAVVAPVKLADYAAINNHPDFPGTVFQGRFYYDAFVLESKKLGLAGIKTLP